MIVPANGFGKGWMRRSSRTGEAFGVRLSLLAFFLDSAIKRAVETIGPDLTKVQVKVDAVNLILLSGSGKISGLMIGNPEGYKSPSAIRAGEVSVAIQPASLLGDKIIVESINVQAPEGTFETDLRQ